MNDKAIITSLIWVNKGYAKSVPLENIEEEEDEKMLEIKEKTEILKK
jgi:hypothetical protein